MTTTLKSVKLRRRGVTLVEIMASVFVLSVGLLGVLAAVPFGGFRLSQMNEADHSAKVGRSAKEILIANGWANPRSWWIRNYTTPEGTPLYAVPGILGSSLGDNAVNLNYPFILDPLSSIALDDYTPRALTFAPNGGYSFIQPYVCPLYNERDGLSVSQANIIRALRPSYERTFYQQDDLITDVEEEGGYTFRPFIDDQDRLGYYDSYQEEYIDEEDPRNKQPVLDFTGRYTWMAFVTPKTNTGNRYRCDLNDIISASFDVVVFKDRILNDQKVFAATIDGSGYQGGNITINLSSALGTNNGLSVISVNSDQDKSRFIEQLEQTRYVLLLGPDDFPVDGATPTFAKWYKIANFGQIKGTENLRLSLIGHDTPKSWSGGRVPISAVFYPGVIGVYSGSVDF